MDLTVLSIFQKAVTFDHNFAIKHNFLAFFIKYFFADKYILNEKSKTNKTVNLKIEFDYRPKRIRFQIEETECFSLSLVQGETSFKKIKQK